jgi:hypothetical protein
MRENFTRPIYAIQGKLASSCFLYVRVFRHCARVEIRRKDSSLVAVFGGVGSEEHALVETASNSNQDQTKSVSLSLHCKTCGLTIRHPSPEHMIKHQQL